jgi:hypothetical protein
VELRQHLSGRAGISCVKGSSVINMRAIGHVALVLLNVAAVATAAAAPPALEPHELGDLVVSTPKGWTFLGDAASHTAIARQDPERKDAAQLLFVLRPNGSATEDQVLDAVTSQMRDLKVVRREAGPGGSGRVLVADGTTDGLQVRAGALAILAKGTVVLGVLYATPGSFDALGGTDLVVAMLASARAAGAAPSPSPSGPAPDGPMQPEYNSVGALVIPPPKRAIGLADLVGEWRRDDGATASYFSTSTGGYVGANSVSIGETWNIDAKGGIKDTFKAAYSGMQGTRGVDQKNTGTVTFDHDGTVVIT